MTIKHIFLNTALLVLISASAWAQCDLFELNTDANPAIRNFSVNCGNVNAAQWDVSNDSCGMVTDPVVMPGDSGSLYTTPVSVRINGSGNLECDDKILISYLIDGVWYPQDTVRGCDFSSVHNNNFNVTCYANQVISVAVSLMTDNSNEKLQIKDGELCFGTAVPAGSLPVLWNYFKADVLEDLIKISWGTSTEIDNDYFSLERSTDGIVFTELARVNGAGNTRASMRYSFDDRNPVDGYAYYRVLQSNYDGKVEYSDLMAVKFEKPSSSEFELYPNPVRGQEVYINFQDLPEEKFLVVLYDQLGRTVFSKVVLTGDEDGFAVAIDQQARLAPGVYLVIGSSRSSLYHKRLVIQTQRDVVTFHINASSK